MGVNLSPLAYTEEDKEKIKRLENEWNKYFAKLDYQPDEMQQFPNQPVNEVLNEKKT